MRKRFSNAKSTSLSLLALSLFSPINCDTSSAPSPTLQPQTVNLPSLNFNGLGNIGLVGSFDGISQYSYIGQQLNAAPPQNPYYDTVIAQLNNDQFLSQGRTNGIVSSSCLLNDRVYFAGNFTTLDSTPSSGFAYINTTSGEVSHPNTSLNGTINTLYCDLSSDSVVVGGSFTFNKTTGVAIYDTTNDRWKSPLFGGFGENSVINSITTTTSSSNYSLIFSGSFNSLNSSDKFSSNLNLTSSKEQQVSFKLAQVLAEGTAPNSDPSSILCPSPSSSWKLTDHRQGTWQASLPFSFSPTRLRLYNLDDPTNGAKTWRFIAFPLNGIMNLTYVDPSSGQKMTCDAWCPLPQRGTTEYLDYEFVDVIGMDSFELFLLDNYGSFSGLSGVELFQDGRLLFFLPPAAGLRPDPLLASLGF